VGGREAGGLFNLDDDLVGLSVCSYFFGGLLFWGLVGWASASASSSSLGGDFLLWGLGGVAAGRDSSSFIGGVDWEAFFVTLSFGGGREAGAFFNLGDDVLGVSFSSSSSARVGFFMDGNSGGSTVRD
jgi:hypothetical protein